MFAFVFVSYYMMSKTLNLHLDYLHCLPGLRKGFRVIWTATIPTFLPCGLECGGTTLYLWVMLASTVVLVGFFVATFRHYFCFGAKLSPCEEPSLGAPGIGSAFCPLDIAESDHWKLLIYVERLFECRADTVFYTVCNTLVQCRH